MTPDPPDLWQGRQPTGPQALGQPTDGTRTGTRTRAEATRRTQLTGEIAPRLRLRAMGLPTDQRETPRSGTTLPNWGNGPLIPGNEATNGREGDPEAQVWDDPGQGGAELDPGETTKDKDKASDGLDWSPDGGDDPDARGVGKDFELPRRPPEHFNIGSPNSASSGGDTSRLEDAMSCFQRFVLSRRAHAPR